LLLLLRDSVDKAADWNTVLDFVRGLPKKFADEPEIQEIRAFAAAQAGNDIQAIALETLIAIRTDTRAPWPDGRPLQATHQGRCVPFGKAADPCQGNRLL
jgi:hypothetical protein